MRNRAEMLKRCRQSCGERAQLRLSGRGGRPRSDAPREGKSPGWAETPKAARGAGRLEPGPERTRPFVCCRRGAYLALWAFKAAAALYLSPAKNSVCRSWFTLMSSENFTWKLSASSSGLNLVIAAIVWWNSTYMADAVTHLRASRRLLTIF